MTYVSVKYTLSLMLQLFRVDEYIDQAFMLQNLGSRTCECCLMCDDNALLLVFMRPSSRPAELAHVTRALCLLILLNVDLCETSTSATGVAP